MHAALWAISMPGTEFASFGLQGLISVTPVIILALIDYSQIFLYNMTSQGFIVWLHFLRILSNASSSLCCILKLPSCSDGKKAFFSSLKFGKLFHMLFEIPLIVHEGKGWLCQLSLFRRHVTCHKGDSQPFGWHSICSAFVFCLHRKPTGNFSSCCVTMIERTHWNRSGC